MHVVNLEIKARCHHPGHVRQVLGGSNAHFAGRDHQVDTYFRVPRGRLKLRQGNIENALIYYHRPDDSGPKQSDVLLYGTPPNSGLKDILENALTVLVEVDKQREIYYVGNVKFHIDQVRGLGDFVEIEAAGAADADLSALLAQSRNYMQQLGIREEDLVAESYSDMILRAVTQT
jgi:predicted adenylyl cyclase CyaB